MFLNVKLMSTYSAMARRELKRQALRLFVLYSRLHQTTLNDLLRSPYLLYATFWGKKI